MNIGVNARFLYPEVLEGLGRYTWETFKNIALNHQEHRYFLFFDRPYSKKYVFQDNIIPVILSPQARHPLLFYLWFEFSLPHALKKYKIDVFYSPDNFCSLKSKVPVVTVVHDLAYLHYPSHIPWAARQYYKYFMPKYLKRSNHIITVSHFVKNDIIAQFGIEESKISVAYNALPSRAEQSSIHLEIKDPYFLYVGSLNPRKNLINALKAFTLFLEENPKFKFIVIGKKSNLDNDTNDLLNHLILEGSVIHLNNITDSELPQYYKNAAALVYVSVFEGFGIPLLEAMNYKVPVITSNVTSLPEVAGNAAYLVNPHEPMQIVEGMNVVTRDSSLKAALIHKGIKRVKDFNWDTTSQIIYRQLLKVK